MKIAITGATGLVGKQLCSFLTGGGHEVVKVVRSKTPAKGEISWDPAAGKLDAAALEGVDAVIHLAGENVAGGCWTAKRKAAIRDSRVKGTTLISGAIASMKRKPSVFIGASAIGYYGTTSGDKVMDESSKAGTGFLSDVCVEWERCTEAARKAGIRTVNARIGVVMAAKGGALSKMLTPFKLGGGGVIGSGKQYMAWVALDDVVGALHWLLSSNLHGPVNLVSPFSSTNREFTKTLAKVLRRPTILPLPGFVVNLLFREMGREMLLGGCRVVPKALIGAGFEFQYPTLESALRHELGR